jgi:uncharacterized integral membrane protein
MWVSGYIVTPILFAKLDRQLAGEVAGQIFQVCSYVAIVCLLLLLAMKIITNGLKVKLQWQFWVLLTALLIVLFGEFYIAEAMREFKSLHPQLSKSSPVYLEFTRLHGMSSVLFLINSLLGLVLVLKYKFTIPLANKEL